MSNIFSCIYARTLLFLVEFELLFSVLHTEEAIARGYCSFPEFLWSASSSSASANSTRQWLSHTVYIENSDRWRKQKQITAHETEYEVSHQVYALCASSGSGGGGVKQPCNRQVIRQRVICIQHEADGKIRVQQQTHRG